MIEAPEFKPLLAAPVDFSKLDYSNVWVSPKLDGIRCIIRNGVVVSRTLKPIPNEFVQYRFGNRPELESYDGELIVGPASASDVYLKTNSGVMSIKGEPDVALWAFDHTSHPNDEYHKRYGRLGLDLSNVVKMMHHPCEDEDDILAIEERYLGLNYEGVMGRAFHGPASWYKFGRATAKSGTLWKLKRLDDFEAQIIGFEEELANENEATKDELGHTKRSSHQENKVGKGTMGVMLLRTADGVEFRCGIFKGFNASWKLYVWQHQAEFIGLWGKIQKFSHGEKDKPRHPRFLGIRSPLDM